MNPRVRDVVARDKSKALSVALTEEGYARAQELFEDLFSK
jgi:hypothetical protein